jgi:uncharacterized membrane protein
MPYYRFLASPLEEKRYSILLGIYALVSVSILERVISNTRKSRKCKFLVFEGPLRVWQLQEKKEQIAKALS